MSCNSHYTSPPFAEVETNLFVGWLGARSLPRWRAVISIVSPSTIQREQDSYRCHGAYTGIVPDATPLFLVDHHDQEPGLTAYFDQVFDFADQHIDHGPIFWHCQAGISRSPFTLATYLAARRGWIFEDALERVQTRRPVVDIWRPFLDEGRRYLRHAAAVQAGTVSAGSYVAPSKGGWVL